MKKALYIFLVPVVTVSAQIVFHPGTTNQSAVVLTTTNNWLYANGYPLGGQPSNTWSLTRATNGLQDGDCRMDNSNGWPVSVRMSNGVPWVRVID